MKKYVSLLVALRFQILSFALLMLLPLAASRGPAVDLLGGLVVLERSTDLAYVVALSLLAAWTLMVSTLLTWTYGREQFECALPSAPSWLLRWRLIWFSIPALVVIVVTLVLAKDVPRSTRVCAALAGFAIAIVLIACASLVRRALVAPGAEVVDLFFGTTGWMPRAIRDADPIGAWRQSATRNALLERLRPAIVALGPGFATREGTLRSGHLASLVFLALLAVAYFAFYFLLFPIDSWPERRPRVLGRLSDAPGPPALAYLLFLLMYTGWALSGVAFILDRYRVPVVLLVMLFVSSLYIIRDRDYYFFVKRPVSAPVAVPVDRVLELGENGRAKDLAVVMAAGGGIQAAAWTARVLTTLHRDVGAEFARKIRVISTASGGGIGAMYYVDRFVFESEVFQRCPPDEACDVPEDSDLGRIVEAAESSALEAVAWGLAYPDLARLVSPVPVLSRKYDRAWALEQAWRRRLRRPDATLGDWAAEIAKKRRPAVIFNATEAESGRRFMFTPIEVLHGHHTNSFFQAYPEADINVVRAARMGATFPWVTPVARAEWTSKKDREERCIGQTGHVADGGYYDNDGAASLLQWLDAVRTGPNPPARLLIIRIAPGSREEEAGRWGAWKADLFGPVLTMLSVRTASQAARNNGDLRRFAELWEKSVTSAYPDTKSRVEFVQFVPGRPGPLSWRMTRDDKDRLCKAWNEKANQEALKRVKEWSKWRPAAGRPVGALQMDGLTGSVTDAVGCPAR